MSLMQKVRWTLFFIFYLGYFQLMSQPQQDPPYINVQGYIPLADKIGHYNYSVQLRGTGKFKAEGQECQIHFYDEGTPWFGEGGAARIYNLSADTFIVNETRGDFGDWKAGAYSSTKLFIIPYNQDIRIELSCYTTTIGDADDYVYYGDEAHYHTNSITWSTQTVISYTPLRPANVTATDGVNGNITIEWDHTSDYNSNDEFKGYDIYCNNDSIMHIEKGTIRSWTIEEYKNNTNNPPVPGRLYHYQVSAIFDSWVGEVFSLTGDCGFMEPNGSIAGRIKTQGAAGIDNTRVFAATDNENLNGALYFDGSDDYINIPYNPDLNPEDEITVEAWVKPDNQIQTDACIYNSGSVRLLARTGSDNRFAFAFKINDTWQWIYDTAPWTAGNWYHVAGTYDGTNTKLYINGIEKNTHTISGSLDDFNTVVTIGCKSDPVAEHFKGILDEVRIWELARDSDDIIADMNRILGAQIDQNGLIAYWRFNPQEPLNFTGDYCKNGGHHGIVNGASLETLDLPELVYYDISGVDGNYSISNIYYDDAIEGTDFTVKPDTSGNREFETASTPVNLEFSQYPDDYKKDNIDFIDQTFFAIKGLVKYRNLDYFVEKVDIIIDDGNVAKTTTDEEGHFLKTLQLGEHTLTPSYYNHSFKPADTTIFVIVADSSIIFEDTTTHILSGKVGGGKASFDIGEAKLKILGPDNCFTDSITTESGQYQIRLSALPDIQVYVNKIDNIPVEDFLFAHEGRLESSKFVSLIQGNDSLDFIYYAKPEVVIEGFPESKTKYYVPVLEQFKKEELTIQIIEDYGGGRICVADSGTMTIHNEITDNFPSIEVPLDSSDNYNFILKAGMPNIISSGLHPHQKRFQVNVATRGGYNTFDQWTIVSGYRPREQTFTTVTPAIPMLILRDPPGDHSYSFLEEGTTTSLTLGMSVLFNEEINTYLQLKAGVAININVGTPFVSIGTGFAQWGLIEDNFTVGASVLGQHEQRLTITNINQYKTSSEETSIGAGSDVYVGAALNIVYAIADVLNVNYIDEIELTKSIVYGVNSEEAFETTYIYTQNHIEQMVIPRLKENFEFATNPDSAQYWSDQIEAWEQIIFLNDSLKQNAEPLSGPGSDISISGGAEKFYSSTITQSTSHTFDFNMYINNEVAWETGLDVAGSGFKFGQRIRTRLNIGSSVSVDTVITNTVGYCIYDNEEIDNFWIKVKSDTTYGTPVFELQQGCYTSHPWESGTNPHERCILTIDGDYVQSDVDPNDKAVFTLELTNTSPSGQSGSYKLNHIPTSNPDGAQLRIFGDPINDLSPFQLTAYQPTNVPLTVEMGPYAYDYEDLQIELRSVYDEQIADTITFSVHFTPACSQVNIYRPEEGWIVNKASNDSLEIILSDYDKSELSNITLQYSVKDRNDWKDALVISETSLPNNNFSFYWRPKTLKDDEYDLRMKVSWSQADGVTYSKKASGVIDRTAPKTFGKPQPADGILHPGENISIKFNENINKNALSTDNVILRNLKTGVVIPIEIIASDREVIINPTIEDKDIENENLQVSVINIQDQYGNGSGKAVVWSFYVNKNPVYWNTSKITKTAVEGDTCTFWAKLRNNGGENVHFNLSSIPWLDMDINSGWINTGEEKIFRFSMSPDLAAGYYRDTLFAEMSKGNEPLILDIQIQNKPPEWTFNPGAFSNNMTLTAGFYIDDIPFSEENDIVAAFIGDTLCGKVKVQKMVPQDEYVAFLMIHSNSTRGSEVNLVIWDASEGQERSITETLTFIADTSYGLASSPDSLHISGALLQTISLNDNWTWFSLGIEAKNMSTAAILDRLRPRDSDLIKGHTAYAQYLPGTGWIGNLDTLHIGHGFKIKINISKDLHYIGDKVTDIHWPIEVKSGWNWIGYLPKETLNINSALASLNTTVEDGDQIKNKNSFAIYNATQSIWEGTLEEMKPGEAYMLKVANDGILNYPGLSGKNISLVKILSARALLTTAPDWQVDASVYEYSMNVTGTVTIDGLPVVTENTLLAAFINNECRGITRPVFVKDKWMFFSTIFSTDVTDDSVQFKVYDADNDQIRDVGIKVDYMADKIIGTPTAPFKLWVGIPTGFEKETEIPKEFALEQNYPNPFNPVTTIRYALKQQEDVKLIIYNMLGQKVKTLVDEPQKAGWYDIRFNAKDLASGVYIYRIKAGKFIKAYKMVIIR